MNKSELRRFFKRLDRSMFIDNEYKECAHYDEALPIGHQQTISQPTLVYAMTCELEIDKEVKVLEIGTGSGYQTAFLAEFAREVYSVERIEQLSLKAQEKLASLDYRNIKFKVGDGSYGWPEYAPYDRIMVTAAAGTVPESLIQQLKPGGRMLIPAGIKGRQELLLIRKESNGSIRQESLGEVRFVELKGKYGWEH